MTFVLSQFHCCCFSRHDHLFVLWFAAQCGGRKTKRSTHEWLGWKSHLTPLSTVANADLEPSVVGGGGVGGSGGVDSATSLAEEFHNTRRANSTTLQGSVRKELDLLYTFFNK